MADERSWTEVASNEVFDKLYSVTKYGRGGCYQTNTSTTTASPPHTATATDISACPFPHGRYWSGAADGARKKFSSVTVAAMKSLLRAMRASPPDADADADGQDDDCIDSLHTRRNAFKMLAFLLTEAAQASVKVDAEAQVRQCCERPPCVLGLR